MAYRRRKRSLFKFWGNKKRRRFNRLDDFNWGGGLGFDWSINSETKKGILIIVLFVLAALSLLGLFDLSGEFGRVVVYILSLIFGDLKWLFPVLAILFGYFLFKGDRYQVRVINYLGALLLALGLTALWHLKFAPKESWLMAKLGEGGGYLGLVLSLSLFKLMGFWGTLVTGLAIFLIGVLLTFEISLYGLMWPIKLFKIIGELLYKFYLALKSWSAGRRFQAKEDDYEEEAELDQAALDLAEEKESAVEGPVFQESQIDVPAAISEETMAIDRVKKFGKKIELPLSLLTDRSGKPTSGDIKANQEIIKKTLANFDIPVEMGEVNVGPTFTQYTLRPADGVKLSKITNLNSDLALALAAHPIRIEAPIPGKSLVGIEIPNQLVAKVTMNELLMSKEFKSRRNNLTIALGKDVSGKPCFTQLDRMPHLLIAGATGSGKSVCINSIIVSLLYQNSPDEIKFILVDPKRVELPIYNGIPYLLTPVITDVKKTINALKWTVVEMDRRFDLLSITHKRNIEVYNQDVFDKLPYIIFVIDELADLMATAALEVEAGIVRLAQMARAVGIYLVLATQRPSVAVITGLIKANIPARIAFSVASLIDSRTILDAAGAEKLVGRGDMLFLGPEVSRLKRLQGVYVSDREIKNIIDYIKKQGQADYLEGVVERQSANVLASNVFGDEEGDSLLAETKEIIRQAGKASASLLQRRLKIGYARAARILDLLEEQGVIGPADGAKPREVFLDKLGGVSSLEFASREYDLSGELRPFETADQKEVNFGAGEDESEVADSQFAEEAEEAVELETGGEESMIEPEVVEAVDETREVEEDEEKNKSAKKVFKEDEWT